MKKIWIFTILVAITLILTFTFSALGNSSQSFQGNVILNTTTGNQSGTDSNSITEAVLGTHNTESDCWVAYNGQVFDITSWLQRHPGGVNAILPYCGTSSAFQQAFTRQHGTRMVSLLMQVGKLMGMLKYQGQLSA